MRTQESEGIGVAAIQERVDFGVICDVYWHGNRLRGCAALRLRFLGFSGLLRQ
jgi:hypothetical protein